MSANSLTFPIPVIDGQYIHASEFNSIDEYAAQGVNRNTTASGYIRQSLFPTAQCDSTDVQLYTVSYEKIVCFNVAGYINVPLTKLPHGHVLKTAGLVFRPHAGHTGAAPAVLPGIALYKYDGSTHSLGTISYVWTGTEPSTYEAGFRLLVPTITETIDLVNYSYHLQIGLEYGANSVSDLELSDLQVNVLTDPSYAGADFSFWR